LPGRLAVSLIDGDGFCRGREDVITTGRVFLDRGNTTPEFGEHAAAGNQLVRRVQFLRSGEIAGRIPRRGKREQKSGSEADLQAAKHGLGEFTRYCSNRCVRTDRRCFPGTGTALNVRR
jgi:hypothetical protein